jgi:hypothetical protein
MTIHHSLPLFLVNLTLAGLSACSSHAPADDLAEVRDGSAGQDAAPRREQHDAGERPANAQDSGSQSDGGGSMVRDAAGAEGGAGDAGAQDGGNLAPFSFFMTSLRAMRELSKSELGFGGDLRFGETGEGAGLRGADKICTTTAERSMPGAGSKIWRAFLSATTGGPDGGPVHAIDRLGEGPWYDRQGRLVAMSKTDLTQVRPASAHPDIRNDLPNEDGVPNHAPDGTPVDNHHVLTGSNDRGALYSDDVAVTCNDWTKSAPDAADAPRCGLAWPRAGGRGVGAQHWLSALNESGCAPAVGIVEMGGPMLGATSVGSGGGYGAIYCFALSP